MRQAEHHQHRGERTGEGRGIDPESRRAERDRPQRAHRRTARDAEDVGVGERIAQQHLHQRARGGEQATAGEGGEGAGEAEFADDARGERAPIARKDPKQLGQGHRYLAGDQRPQQRHEGCK